MGPVDVNKYYLFCMGIGYLDRKRYNADLAHERGLEQVFFARQATENKAQQTAFLQPRQPFFLTQGEARQQQNPVQQFFANLFQPVQGFAAWIARFLPGNNPAQNQQNAAMLLQPGRVLAGMESVLNKVVSFFFGFKKDKTEERKKRDDDDFADTDLFTRRTVEKSFAGGQNTDH